LTNDIAKAWYAVLIPSYPSILSKLSTGIRPNPSTNDGYNATAGETRMHATSSIIFHAKVISFKYKSTLNFHSYIDWKSFEMKSFE